MLVDVSSLLTFLLTATLVSIVHTPHGLSQLSDLGLDVALEGLEGRLVLLMVGILSRII